MIKYNQIKHNQVFKVLEIFSNVIFEVHAVNEKEAIQKAPNVFRKLYPLNNDRVGFQLFTYILQAA